MKKIIVALLSLGLFGSPLKTGQDTAQKRVSETKDIVLGKTTIKYKIDLKCKVENGRDFSLFIHCPVNDLSQKLITANGKANYGGKAELQKRILKCGWSDVENKNLECTLEALIEKEGKLYMIENPGKLPIDDMTAEHLRAYLKPSYYVDINEKIKKKALEIVGEEKNILKVVHKLVKWINRNIKYVVNGDTESIKPASWVLEHRIGLCDEFSHLFAAFARSLGIPTKLVLGYAPSINGFGLHAWTEIYIPNEKKWIPIDLTYYEWGWSDPYKIKLASSAELHYPIFYSCKECELKNIWFGKKIDLLNSEDYLMQKNIVDIYTNPKFIDCKPGTISKIEIVLKNNIDSYLQTNFYIVGNNLGIERKFLRGDVVLLEPNREKKFEIYFVSPIKRGTYHIDIHTQFKSRTIVLNVK